MVSALDLQVAGHEFKYRLGQEKFRQYPAPMHKHHVMKLRIDVNVTLNKRHISPSFAYVCQCPSPPLFTLHSDVTVTKNSAAINNPYLDFV